MCPDHWAKVPKEKQAAVLDAYRPGQCDAKPSADYFVAAGRAIEAVLDATRDFDEGSRYYVSIYLRQAERLRKKNG
jgi:hypothetical protein